MIMMGYNKKCWAIILFLLTILFLHTLVLTQRSKHVSAAKICTPKLPGLYRKLLSGSPRVT